MFISISYVCVFVQYTIKWPYQPKHSPSFVLQCKVQLLKKEEKTTKIRKERRNMLIRQYVNRQ